ncbi:hypothetical protein [Streptomyces spongiae]|uniref:Uncharacterized protein n=1 Tax=Streptomyces spongiae TaxID=565072 RepID=A0A5N8XI71_9ACTN|nr:hypothetical protein [Streptomyces spongiae]MPY59170.1 hypothetical protein [Streptomyces spongiae]
MPGEDAHLVGAEAVERAKTWLEATMRVSQAYTNVSNRSWARRLTLRWPHGDRREFSYDLGGLFRGGEWDGEMFCAEVKWRKNASDQGTEYRAYLAKCYVALAEHHALSEHFLWISWAPFRASEWDQLASQDEIRRAVLGQSTRVLGTDDPDEAVGLIKGDVVEELTQRLWKPLVMSERQEQLVPLDEWRAVVAEHCTKQKDMSW